MYLCFLASLKSVNALSAASLRATLQSTVSDQNNDEKGSTMLKSPKKHRILSRNKYPYQCCRSPFLEWTANLKLAR